MSDTLYIIDGHAQMFRCYYAPFRPLNAPSGEPTKGTYVFTQMLISLVREKNPTHLVMVVDSPEPTFRDELYDAYKATREPAPEDFAPQAERILQIVAAAGVRVLAKPGFEADDIIATLARRARKHDLDVVLVSKDKDLEQLLTDRIRMYDPNKDETVGPEELRQNKGYGPEQAVEVQTLTGDTVDNIPGVKGVGPKTAAKLIDKYGTAAAVIEHADELTPAQKQNVLAFADKIDLTRKLVALHDDVPIDLTFDDLRITGLHVANLKPIFDELGFNRLLTQLDEVDSGAAPETPPTPKPRETLFDDGPPVAGGTRDATTAATADYDCIDTPATLKKLAAELKKQKRFAFDTETTSLNPVAADLVGLSFSWNAGHAYYVPIRAGGENRLRLDTVRDLLAPILGNETIRKVGQNLKYDITVLAQHDVPVRGADFDTMIASFVLDSARRSHSMDALAFEILGHRTIPISDLIGAGKNQIGFDEVPLDRATEYAAEDADITWRLYEHFAPQLEKSDVKDLFHDTEIPLVDVLATMEQNGVAVDTDILAKMSNDLAARIEKLRDDIHEAAGRPFNIDSTRQLAEVLFDELGLRVVKKTKTARSTDAETLATLAHETGHDLPRLVLEYRELVKLKSTYVDTLPEMVCEKTGRIHASFHQTGAVTGRLSSSDPNLQNIPVRTELGRQIRKAFVPGDKKRNVLLTADYSQIELRVLAHFCKDAALLEAFTEGRDIHAAVASQVFDVPLSKVTKEQRSRAKAVNFGIIYGQGPYGLARQTGINQTEAKKFIQRYFARYPGIREFVDATIAAAKKDGFVRTILGRRRAIEDINSRNRQRAAAAERFAVNTVTQGSAADLIKRAMINIHRRIRDENHPSRMLIQVHDELVFETPRKTVESEADMIRDEMTTALPLDVPIQVDIAWGQNWLEGK
jgi:DNA polymerase-1